MSGKTTSLSERFAARFGVAPRVFRAPGRVNLIGEHTDYNDGFVLPIAVDLSCWVAAAPRGDGTIVVHSENVGEHVELGAEDRPLATGTWRDYVLGVAMLLRDLGLARAGATLLVDSEVPAGAGLSSSAALEVAVATALLGVSGTALDPLALARLCQQAENTFAGAACGIMDQYTACHARAGAALLLDCRALTHSHLQLPEGVRVVACNSMVRHAIAGGEYNRRRVECTAAVETIARRHPGIRSLRDVGSSLLEASRGHLSELLYRRARHVVTENARVQQMAAALDAGDLALLAPLMADSHRSMRDDFEITCPEVDALVEDASQLPGILGARMTGGGFGGCTVNLVHVDAVSEFRAEIKKQYKRRTGLETDVYVFTAADRAGEA